MSLPPGSKTTFYRAMATLAIVALGIVSYSLTERVTTVEHADACQQDIHSLACKVRTCVRAASVAITTKECRQVLKAGRRKGIINSSQLPDAQPIGSPGTGTGKLPGGPGSTRKGGGPSNPQSGNSQPAPSGGLPTVDVPTPALPLVPTPTVCTPILGVNC